MMIGVLGRPTNVEYGRYAYKLSNELKEIIWKYGAIAFLITGPNQYDMELNAFEKEKLKEQLLLCDGIILQGGSDIYPYDYEVLRLIDDMDIPVFGICLGMQLMAEYHSGVVSVINGNHFNHAYPTKEYVHCNDILCDSKLFQIVKSTNIKVNSRHLEHVVSTSLSVSSYSSDGIIEAVENTEKDFYIGVQWHPESMFEYDKVTRMLWKAFFDSVRRYHERRGINSIIATKSCCKRKAKENKKD